MAKDIRMDNAVKKTVLAAMGFVLLNAPLAGAGGAVKSLEPETAAHVLFRLNSALGHVGTGEIPQNLRQLIDPVSQHDAAHWQIRIFPVNPEVMQLCASIEQLVNGRSGLSAVVSASPGGFAAAADEPSSAGADPMNPSGANDGQDMALLTVADTAAKQLRDKTHQEVEALFARIGGIGRVDQWMASDGVNLDKGTADFNRLGLSERELDLFNAQVSQDIAGLLNRHKLSMDDADKRRIRAISSIASAVEQVHKERADVFYENLTKRARFLAVRGGFAPEASFASSWDPTRRMWTSPYAYGRRFETLQEALDDELQVIERLPHPVATELLHAMRERLEPVSSTRQALDDETGDTAIGGEYYRKTQDLIGQKEKEAARWGEAYPEVPKAVKTVNLRRYADDYFIAASLAPRLESIYRHLDQISLLDYANTGADFDPAKFDVRMFGPFVDAAIYKGRLFEGLGGWNELEVLRKRLLSWLRGPWPAIFSVGGIALAIAALWAAISLWTLTSFSIADLLVPSVMGLCAAGMIFWGAKGIQGRKLLQPPSGMEGDMALHQSIEPVPAQPPRFDFAHGPKPAEGLPQVPPAVRVAAHKS